ncbi:LANO_0G12222g1_1 [Lachancea nothofagi CBS 11611]|uniref:LANO_0G12222g1_1 n=1 Tax=Lachancea nothofagi CBS 11611 TaxID=1266666 RepID=A0A1G4KK65_9SACH|nr:LANO_0G12222g1_1 [Lachancea nothofagi CBS 11611]
MKASSVLRNTQSQPSPHALIYRRWAKPVGKSLMFCVGSYYALYWAWELLEKGEREYELKQKKTELAKLV